jgi:iron complex outermembrane recepter protein
VFTDFTLHLTDRFDIQLGGREGHNHQTYDITTTGPLTSILLGAPSPVIAPQVDSSDSSFTYLVTPRYKLSSAWMAYARLASGYRPGGPNDTQEPSVPRSFAPDRTQNYELGTKGEFLDRRLTVDTSLYYILWRNVQLSLYDPVTFIDFTGNGGRAKSQGIEFTVQAKPLTGLTASSWVVLSEAKLTQALPIDSSALGADGSPLPYSSRFSGNFALQQDFPLTSGMAGFVGGLVSYVGNREGEFASAFAASAARQYYPAYARSDLHGGLKMDEWLLNLYVNNVADKSGVLAGGLGTFPAFAFNYIQPRTVGINLSHKF